MQAVGAGYRVDELFDAILINVTGFFRDPETWDVVASDVIPKLLAEKPPDSPIRVWSAGCASGEEAYTIAMLLAEGLGDEAYRDPRISRVDLLISRNTLMYFSSELQERILANFHAALNRGGFLVGGHAEALQRIFVRDGTAHPAFYVPRPAIALARVLEGPETDELEDAAFEHSPVAQIVVDGENRIAAVNQAARTLFGIKMKDVGGPLRDLEVSHRPVELRSLIDEARHERRPTGVKNVTWETGQGMPRSLDVHLAPLAGRGDTVLGVGVSFVDSTVHRSLEQRLETTRRELETAYEELQSTVEELETMNEELQSTTEELETTNEELQSTNEQLETMNEELQSTNEQLETMNDELRERTDETQRSNAFMTSVLASIRQAVVVVDGELRVVAWSTNATELLGPYDDEVEGRVLVDLDVGLPVARLADPIRRVLGGNPGELVVLDGHDRRGHAVGYEVRVAPLLGDFAGAPVAGAILLVSAERTACRFHHRKEGR